MNRRRSNTTLYRHNYAYVFFAAFWGRGPILSLGDGPNFFARKNNKDIGSPKGPAKVFLAKIDIKTAQKSEFWNIIVAELKVPLFILHGVHVRRGQSHKRAEDKLFIISALVNSKRA